MLLYHHSVSHTFIRNLVINQSLEARSCHSHSLWAPSSPPWAQFSWSRQLISMQPRASRIQTPLWFWIEAGNQAEAPSTDFKEMVSAMKKGSERKIFIRVRFECRWSVTCISAVCWTVFRHCYTFDSNDNNANDIYISSCYLLITSYMPG